MQQNQQNFKPAREIKFRVWDVYNERMVYDPDRFEPAYTDDEKLLAPSVFYETWQDRDDGIRRPCFVMEFTGVKDKHGKEVFEGDIVTAWSAGSKGKFEIKWRQDGAPMWLLYPAWQLGEFWNIAATHHTPGKQFIDVSGKIEATKLEGYFDDGIEVIGNIYANPDMKPLRGGV